MGKRLDDLKFLEQINWQNKVEKNKTKEGYEEGQTKTTKTQSIKVVTEDIEESEVVETLTQEEC